MMAYLFYSRFYKHCISEKIQLNVNNLALLCYVSILSWILIIFNTPKKTGKNFKRNGQFFPEKLIFKVKKYVCNRATKKVLKLTTLTTFRPKSAKVAIFNTFSFTQLTDD